MANQLPVFPEAKLKAEKAEEEARKKVESGMVFVKGDCFQMGDTFGDGGNGDGGNDEKPVHEACVGDFYMDKYEVTQKNFQRVIGNNPSNFKNCDDCPVERVTWDEAKGYCEDARAGKRLPTEAEWEFAAREGGKKVRFGTGKDTIGPDEANFDASADYKESYSRIGEYRGKTLPVGSFAPNALGLYDMSGNVWEWVSDWYDAIIIIRAAPRTIHQAHRVVRTAFCAVVPGTTLRSACVPLFGTGTGRWDGTTMTGFGVRVPVVSFSRG